MIEHSQARERRTPLRAGPGAEVLRRAANRTAPGLNAGRSTMTDGRGEPRRGHPAGEERG